MCGIFLRNIEFGRKSVIRIIYMKKGYIEDQEDQLDQIRKK